MKPDGALNSVFVGTKENKTLDGSQSYGGLARNWMQSFMDLIGTLIVHVIELCGIIQIAV